MSKAIWKFPVSVTDKQIVYMPAGARLLHIAEQGSAGMYLWAQVDTEAEIVPRAIRIFGTGQPMPDDPGIYIGTFQLKGGALVFHAYDTAH